MRFPDTPPGSERLDKSGAKGARAKEAMAINKSLSALGDVIAARANAKGHVPYRNSALTYLLQDSLAGDSKTMMISQIRWTHSQRPAPRSASPHSALSQARACLARMHACNHTRTPGLCRLPRPH